MREMEYQRLLETAVEQSFSAAIITTANLDLPGPTITYVNPAMTSMSGYSREELLGATPRLLQGPKTDREILHRLRVALEAGEYFEANTVNYRKDGTPYQVEWNISPVRNEAGVITHFVSVQHDITRAFEDQKQIRMLSSALEMSSDSIVMTDAAGDIEYVNRTFERYTGYDRDIVIGQNPRLLKSGQHSAQFYRNMWDTLTRGETFHDIFIDQDRDGQCLYIEQTITPVKDEHGHIVRYVSLGKDITRRMQHEQELKRIASTDMLTGLANRLNFDLRLETEVEQTRRYGRPLSLIMLDIDQFKSINDSHGHDVGDQVLVRLARVLLENIRMTDLCARWGGEEFIVIAPETALPKAVLLAEKLRRAIAGKDFPVVGQVTASFGVVEVGPDELATRLLKRADQVLYQAKTKGRNRVMVS
ncbi:sensor domain-containing diguanylate cyclase [Vreelandella rituensis]|uniref:Diguanylate cyclase n=1 Tax=Vreelandella rituensis TaxID=2282306 RepID=A0A368TRA0_9GAMM|nr:sensor domain-containing diguanylate cyclase [Halomonas rituensis]RCV86757.1 diguanylate cyclase [Halomonas rituensis]